MLPEKDYYYRCSVYSMEGQDAKLKKKIGVLKEKQNKKVKLGVNQKAPIFGRVWNLKNLLVEYDADEFALASNLDLTGPGAFTVESRLNNKSFGFFCDPPLIQNGVIINMGNAGQNYKASYIATTNFIVPETIYNPFGYNPKLPSFLIDQEEEIETRFTYVTQLSECQAPPEKYSKESQTLNWMMKNEKGNFLIVQKEKPEDSNDIPMILINMINSSSNTVRLSTEDYGLNESLKKTEPVPKYQPVPIRKTEMSYYFNALTGRDLSSYCSYGYQDGQFSSFVSGTNHVISGRLVGGFNVAMYYDDVQTIKKEMLEANPNVHVLNATFVTFMIFSSLYPPDSPDFNEYAVCINPLKYSTTVREWDMFCDCSNSIFKVYPNQDNPGDYKRPYCSFYVPFDCSGNESIPSFVQYLPYKSITGETAWKDVIAESSHVYTQVRVFVSNQLQIEDLASIPSRYEHARVMIGCPNLNGDYLKQFSLLTMPTMWGVYSDTDIFERYVLAEGNSRTSIFNMYCCFQNLKCTPTDFKVQNKEEEDEEEENNSPLSPVGDLRHKLALLRFEEVAHKF